MPDGNEKRREPRFPARIVARMQRRGEAVDLLTNDVSFKGAFVRTDAPPAPRQLIKLSFTTPLGRTVNVHAMVVYVVEPGDPSRVPGVGVQFFGRMDEPRAWEGYVQDLRVRAKEGTLTASAIDKVRRSSERFRMSLDVDVGGDAAQTRDISMTGMAIRTDLSFEVGMRVHLTVRAMGYGELEVDVIVRRQIREPDFEGVGVEFIDPSAEVLSKLRALTTGGLPSEEVIFADPDDPELH